MKKNNNEFNMKAWLESDEYTTKKLLLNKEINSNTISIPVIERDTKSVIKAAKKAYSKLKGNMDAFDATRDGLLMALANSAKKEYKSNFILKLIK